MINSTILWTEQYLVRCSSSGKRNSVAIQRTLFIGRNVRLIHDYLSKGRLSTPRDM